MPGRILNFNNPLIRVTVLILVLDIIAAFGPVFSFITFQSSQINQQRITQLDQHVVQLDQDLTRVLKLNQQQARLTQHFFAEINFICEVVLASNNGVVPTNQIPKDLCKLSAP